MEITTIKLTKDTKQRLDKFRRYRRETYEEILSRMLEILNLCRINPERAQNRLVGLDKVKKRENKQKTTNKINLSNA